MHTIGGKLSINDLQQLLEAGYTKDKEVVGNFIYDKEISSPTSMVFYNPHNNQAVVVHQGTQGLKDWINNAVYGFSGISGYKTTSRFKEAEKVQKNAEKKYGAKHVSTIGHSQGGLQAELLGGKSKETITLNKATAPFRNKKNKNQYDIRSSHDIVSALNPFDIINKKNITIKKMSYNPLTEHSTNILSRLEGSRMVGKNINNLRVRRV